MKTYQYRAIHTAVRAVWGKPNKCRLCKGRNKSKRYEWSNKDHKYTLTREDWWELCATCHRRWDKEHFGHKVWNKGLIGLQNWHNVKGLNNGKPWNKGKKLTNDQKKRFRKNYRKTRAITGNSPYLIENKLI
jgi:hypothetical protein